MFQSPDHYETTQVVPTPKHSAQRIPREIYTEVQGLSSRTETNGMPFSSQVLLLPIALASPCSEFSFPSSLLLSSHGRPVLTQGLHHIQKAMPALMPQTVPGSK